MAGNSRMMRAFFSSRVPETTLADLPLIRYLPPCERASRADSSVYFLKFGPGLVTGSLIGRFGVLPVIVAGCLSMLACVAIALSGVELMQFLAALILLGVGWNFMYTGATTLLTDYAQPADEEQVWSIWQGNARVKR